MGDSDELQNSNVTGLNKAQLLREEEKQREEEEGERKKREREGQRAPGRICTRGNRVWGWPVSVVNVRCGCC